MARVMFNCPTTGNPVASRMAFDSLDGIDLSNITINPCPHCGQSHTWQGEDAYLEGEPPTPRRS